jgi:hypothetical protein
VVVSVVGVNKFRFQVDVAEVAEVAMRVVVETTVTLIYYIIY